MGFFGEREWLCGSVPKILGLNVGMFELFLGSPELCLEIGFDHGTVVFWFLLCIWSLGLFLAKFWK